MADYHSPAVVQPSLPVGDMTPLERLILGYVFEAEKDGERVYYFSLDGPCEFICVPVDDLRMAWRGSQGLGESGIGDHVAALLARFASQAGGNRSDTIDIDLTEPTSNWDRMFQDIVRRSATIKAIEVTTSFTCSKMRPDGFGGSAMLITADAIRYKSTMDIFEEFWNEADKAGSVEASPPASA